MNYNLAGVKAALEKAMTDYLAVYYGIDPKLPVGASVYLEKSHYSIFSSQQNVAARFVIEATFYDDAKKTAEAKRAALLKQLEEEFYDGD